MAHKTLIDGVAYEISGGKTLVDGTAYSIKNGKILAGGTAYEIGFESFTPVLSLGTVEFSAPGFFPFSLTTVYRDTPWADVAVGDLSAINAVRFGDVIVPLPYPGKTQGAGWANYDVSTTAMSAPTSEGDTYVFLDQQSDGRYSATIYLYQQIAACEVVLGTI